MQTNQLISLCFGILALSACGGSPDVFQNPIPTAPPEVGETVAGKHYNVNLTSKVDGANIAMTFFEPTEIVGGQTYPLVMNSHGFGGSRTQNPNAFITRLRDAGYAVLTLDQRGHGQSGGEIEALNPEREGKDMSQALDWAEENASWLRYEFNEAVGTTNLVLGTYGGSYGGGFQHTILSWDEKQRLDVMVPDITWHHLTYSFAPNLVLKTAWVTLLEAGGNAAGSGGNNADWIDQAFLEATTTNNVSQGLIDEYFDKYGMNNYCALSRPYKVDALYTQGVPDVLFNLNELYKNYQCVSALGGDVRIFTHQSGHILPIQADGGSYNCGDLNHSDATFDWFEAKLSKNSPQAADYLPEVCMNMANNDAEHLDSFQLGHPNDETHDFVIPTFTVGTLGPGSGSGQAQIPPIVHELGTGDGHTMLAGIPEITVDMDIPCIEVGGQEQCGPVTDGTGDPRVFIGVGYQKAGTSNWVLVDDQVMPFRGYAEDVDQLVGITQRLGAGDKYALLFYAVEQFFAGSASRESEPAVKINVSVEMPLVTDPSNPPQQD